MSLAQSRSPRYHATSRAIPSCQRNLGAPAQQASRLAESAQVAVTSAGWRGLSLQHSLAAYLCFHRPESSPFSFAGRSEPRLMIS